MALMLELQRINLMVSVVWNANGEFYGVGHLLTRKRVLELIK